MIIFLLKPFFVRGPIDEIHSKNTFLCILELCILLSMPTWQHVGAEVPHGELCADQTLVHCRSDGCSVHSACATHNNY